MAKFADFQIARRFWHHYIILSHFQTKDESNEFSLGICRNVKCYIWGNKAGEIA
jgi:hypothetical protein